MGIFDRMGRVISSNVNALLDKAEDPKKGFLTFYRDSSGENCMTHFDRITSDPNRMNGQPCVRNLRLTVRRVLEALATYPERTELLREYPELEAEDIRQILAYAAAALDDKILALPKSA